MQDTVRLFTGKKFLIVVVGFFGVIMAVNAVFITLALKSNPGVVTKDYYQRGINYNETLEQARYQKELGWVGTLTASYSSGRISYRLLDKDGHPLSGKTILVRMVRPVQAGYDFEISLNEGRAGIYEADFYPPLKGNWDAHIDVTSEGDRDFHDFMSLNIE
ncbi:MAG: FixH family protein [Pseudobdellovibrionaceae bacterium]|jgi:nitrogen fixation protein FixH|nr:FixH family protein [Pseudobdellovibrionaceae bacterium]